MGQSWQVVKIMRSKYVFDKSFSKKLLPGILDIATEHDL